MPNHRVVKIPTIGLKFPPSPRLPISSSLFFQNETALGARGDSGLMSAFNGSGHFANHNFSSRNLKADLVNSAEPPFLLALNRGYLARLPQKLAKAF